jgi:hypothetical protein
LCPSPIPWTTTGDPTPLDSRRRPWKGRRRANTSCRATKRAPSLSVSVAAPVGLTCPDTPPAAGRAWVPGCRAPDVPTSVPPFYVQNSRLKRPWAYPIRDLNQFCRSHAVNQWLTGSPTTSSPEHPRQDWWTLVYKSGRSGSKGALLPVVSTWVAASGYEYSDNPPEGTGHRPGTYAIIRLAEAASGHLGSIREPNAGRLFYKDGAGLPPQGRTVRAAPALPPGGGRLLSAVRPRPSSPPENSRAFAFPAADPFKPFTPFVF